jgi:hypothetical protein
MMRTHATVTLSSTARRPVWWKLDDHVHGDGGQRGDGDALVLSLSNGQSITIAVGQTTGSVSYAVARG